MPEPKQLDRTAHATGLFTLPFTIGGSLFLGYKFSPTIAPLPANIADVGAFATLARSLPMRHVGIVGVGSAVTAAVTCRVVQYRGGS